MDRSRAAGHWLPDGRQVQRRLGPAWTGRGRPATGYLTRRSAQAVLDELLAQARAGTLPGMVRTGATFAQASREWLRWQEVDRQRKRSTLDDYRSAVRVHLDPTFEHLQLEEITPRLVDQWRRSLIDERGLSNRSVNKLLVLLHGICERARKIWGYGTTRFAASSASRLSAARREPERTGSRTTRRANKGRSATRRRAARRRAGAVPPSRRVGQVSQPPTWAANAAKGLSADLSDPSAATESSPATALKSIA